MAQEKNLYILPLYTENIQWLFKNSVIADVKKGVCSIDGCESIDNDFFLLVGRHKLLNTQTSWIGTGQRITRTYKIQGAYIPISKKAFAAVKNKLNLLRFMTMLFLSFTIISIPLMITSDEVKAWQITLFFSFIVSLFFEMRREKIIENLSLALVNLTSEYDTAGIPKYNKRAYKDLIKIVDIYDLSMNNKLITLKLNL